MTYSVMTHHRYFMTDLAILISLPDRSHIFLATMVVISATLLFME